jgi:hypothetical protein
MGSYSRKNLGKVQYVELTWLSMTYALDVTELGVFFAITCPSFVQYLRFTSSQLQVVN